MRVLQITSGLGMGGAERSLLALSHHLVERVELVVANLSAADAIEAELPCPVWRYQLRARPWRDLSALRAAAKAFAPDVIHGWMYHGNLVASHISARCGRPPVIWSVRHSLEQLNQERAEIRALVRLGASRVLQPRRVVYNSFCGWQTHARRGYGSKPSMIISNGVDTDHFQPANTHKRQSARAALGIPTEAAVIGCVARFHPMKGIATLVDSLAHLGHGQPVQLLLAGAGMEPGNAELQALLAAAGLAESTQCLGIVADMRRVYAALDALVLPSMFGEGTPNVLLEAQACGVPTVASRVGDAQRVVNEEAALVTPGDVAALRTALRRLLALSAADRAALVARQRERMENEYSLERCNRAYLDLYHELAGSRAA